MITVNITSIFLSYFYYVLNMLAYVLPDDGEWLPKHVCGIKELLSLCIPYVQVLVLKGAV